MEAELPPRQGRDTEETPKKRRGMLRPVLLSLLVLLTLIAALAGAVGWLGSSTGGLQALARLAMAASGGRLHVEQADGRLLGPLRIGLLRWDSPELQLRIEQLRIDWSPGELLDGRLQIAELAAERLQLAVSGDEKRQPPPVDLVPPVAIDIVRLTIGQLQYGSLPPVRDLAAGLAGDGARYTLTDLRAGVGEVGLHARATLGTTAPLPLAASAELSGRLDRHPLALSLSASGPLAQIELAATAREGVRGQAQIVLTPFAAAPFSRAHVALAGIDPAAWQAGAPQARLDVQADLRPKGEGIAGQFSLTNAIPGPLDRQRLPLASLRGNVDWAGDSAELADLRAVLPGAGELAGRGRWQDKLLHLELTASRLDAAKIHTALRPTRLGGPLTASLGSARQSVKFDLKDAAFTLAAEASHADGLLTLPRFALGAGPARLAGQGELALQDMAFRASGELARFDPARFAEVPAAELNARFDVRGKLAARPLIEGNFDLADSVAAGQPLRGQGRVAIDWPHIRRADIELVSGPNRLRSSGAFGRAGDTLAVAIDAPQLAPYGLEGGISGRLDLGGSVQQLQLAADLQAETLGRPGHFRLGGLRLTASAGGARNAPLHVDLAVARIDTPEQPGLLRALHVAGDGSNEAHRLAASLDLAGSNHLTLAIGGGLFRENGEQLWRGEILQAALRAEDQARNFRLSAPSPLQIGDSGWRLGPAQLAGAPLDWQATLQAEADSRHLRASLNGRGSRLGLVEASLDAGVRNPWSLNDAAPWQGRLKTEIADLGWLAELIGEPWQSAGRFAGDIGLAGTPAHPVVDGRLRGEKLALRLPGQGLDLAHGELDIELANSLLKVRKLGFDSLLQPLPRPLRLAGRSDLARLAERPGRLEVTGEMRLDDSAAGGPAFLDVHLERLGAWQLPDQWIAVSGDGRLTWQDGTLGARGKLAVDAGYWQLARGGTPQLSDDVVIKRPASEKKPAGLRPKLDLDIGADFGRNFHFKGAGLSARLAGDVRLRASGRDLPRATGTIRAVDGRFDAYGQQLAIERGILTFQGLLDNPALDVRAVRNGLSVEPGVQISGTAKKPVVRLISDPELPDAEKLAWLVLGHGPEQMGGGDATVLLSAAGGLLGNESGGLVQQLKTRFGFDEFGVRTGQIGDIGGRQPTSRVVGSGIDSAETTGQQIFSVGKRLSSNALLSYERTLGTAESVVKLTVNLSRRVSVVGRAGSDNALDIFYTLTFGRREKDGESQREK